MTEENNYKTQVEYNQTLKGLTENLGLGLQNSIKPENDALNKWLNQSIGVCADQRNYINKLEKILAITCVFCAIQSLVLFGILFGFIK